MLDTPTVASSVHYSSKKMTWATPWPLFNALDSEFRFTLDVCATDVNRKCARFFSPDDDALALDWGKDICWMNPPYGRELPLWIAKAARSAEKGAVVVCLVPARPDTDWFRIAWNASAEVRFLHGRVTFEGAAYSAPFPSALFIMRPEKPLNRLVTIWDQP